MNGVVNGVQCTPDQPLCHVPNPKGASDGGITKAGKDLLNGLNVATWATVKDYIKCGGFSVAFKAHGWKWDTVFTYAPSKIGVTGGIVVAAAGITLLATILVAYASGIDYPLSDEEIRAFYEGLAA